MGHCVLHLLIAHHELNPNDLIWAQVNGYAASNNKTFAMAGDLILSHDGSDTVTAEN